MTRYQVFGLQSRLGMQFPPHGQTLANAGVEEGPTRLLEVLPDWLSDDSAVHNIAFPLPNALSSDHALSEIATFFQSAKTVILDKWQPGQIPVFLGGDHAIGLISLAAISQRLSGKRIAVIQFDSHGDLHLPTTSPSGNFHGMWMRAALDTFSNAAIDALVQPKIPMSNWRLIGNPVLEEEEIRFMKEHQCEAITSTRLQSDSAGIRSDLTHLLQNVDHVHISFDIDVFAANLVPGTGTPNPRGMSPAEVWPLITAIRTPLMLTGATLSLDLVEFNPQRDIQNKTQELALAALERILRP
jgi:arginase